VDRVYFGNWLRDYRWVPGQYEGLSTTKLVTLVVILGFLSFDYASGDFEVKDENLNVYFPAEHIDNPKGYGEGTGLGDGGKNSDRRLRGPVMAEELDIDPTNGMKAYIASENKGFDTSTAILRSTLRRAIELGRSSIRNGNVQDRRDGMRELGKALHILEDFLAHSNWCEVSLVKLGYKDVFCFVGDNAATKVQTSSGPAPPIVTGTFGSLDFVSSMIGEGHE
ncbi:heterokaryon incompatibility Het-C, partial [Mycena capillaripes]